MKDCIFRCDSSEEFENLEVELKNFLGVNELLDAVGCYFGIDKMAACYASIANDNAILDDFLTSGYIHKIDCWEVKNELRIS